MNILLNKNLEHQIKAVNAVAKVFEDANIFENSNNIYSNPIIEMNNIIQENIKKIQKENEITEKQLDKKHDILILDIKMETGTGKTYVYTKTIYELHKRYKLNKFIILVPSLAIKSGTKQFIEDEYTKEFFKTTCSYGTTIDLEVLNAVKKNKNKKNNMFPKEIRNFVSATKYNKSISVLLVNSHLFLSTLMTRDDYENNISGYTCPLDALKDMNTVLIIDEPHRFSKGNKTFTKVIESIKPQLIIRYGATFPDIKQNNNTVKDYENLLYNLNAAKAFNNNLVKGISKEHAKINGISNGKIKINKIENKQVIITHINDNLKKQHILSVKDSLSVVDNSIKNIYIEGVIKSTVVFSNGIEKKVGEEIAVDIYMSDYQSAMIKLALERHFETEYKNFCNYENKIKTLALFFIDDISSYRNTDKSQAYLLNKFEEILKEMLVEQIKKYESMDEEYKNYLEASLNNISKCHAGYFSKDNSSSEEEIANEIELILKGKKDLLKIKNENGEYHLTRFLFSKWTLKEGWDNPNVFTIAKLRSSGSEISKLQEVGRGLRLPVDEKGNRIDNQEFRLNYIIDFTEKDFAEKLINEINADIPDVNIISDDMLEKIAKEENKTSDDLFEELLSSKYINRHGEIKIDKRDELFAKYPILNKGLNKGKVRDRNKGERISAKIRVEEFNKIKDLWSIINQKCIILYDKEIDNIIDDAVFNILQDNVFHVPYIEAIREDIDVKNNNIKRQIKKISAINQKLDYNVFLKKICSLSNIPIQVMHRALCKYDKEINKIDNKFFNEVTISNILSKFHDWESEKLEGYFKYKKYGKISENTALTNKNGELKEEVLQSMLGKYVLTQDAPDKYLYDTVIYDSELEKENILTGDDKIIVYGKIPKNSISIPIFIGGSYSPDFMYIVKHSSGKYTINLIIETKDVKYKEELRDIEKMKIRSANKFFDELAQNNIKIHFTKQMKEEKIYNIIEENTKEIN